MKKRAFKSEMKMFCSGVFQVAFDRRKREIWQEFIKKYGPVPLFLWNEDWTIDANKERWQLVNAVLLSEIRENSSWLSRLLIENRVCIVNVEDDFSITFENEV